VPLCSFLKKVSSESTVLKNCYPLALGMMFLPFWCLLVAVFGFIVLIPMTKYHFIVAFALTLATIAWGCRWNWKKSVVQGLLFTAGTLVCAGYASLFEADGWWDNIAYHKPPVIAMKNGWNPIWEYNSARQQELEGDCAWYWSEHYSKSDWYTNAVFYAFSGNLALGHLAHMFYVFVTFMVVFAASRSLFHLPDYQSFVLSLIAALNPWVIVVCFDGYVDGALGSCLSILFFAFAAYLKSKDQRFLPFVVTSIVIVTNLKFTGVVYVAVFLICILSPYAVLGIRAKKPLNRPLAGSLVLATVLALIAGINPYLYHLYYHYTPFYPLHTVRKIDEPDKKDFMKVWKKCCFANANPLQQFVFQYLSVSDYRHQWPSAWEGETHGVYTITVNKIFKAKSLNLNCLGHLFFVSMWFSLIMMPLIRRKEFWFFLIAVWASIWVQPHVWHVRYVPHLWLIPVIVTGALLSEFHERAEYRRRIALITGVALLCMLVSVMPFHSSLKPRVKSQAIGVVAYFVQRHPHVLYFDTNYPNGFRYTITTRISDLLPEYSFDKSLETDTSRQLLHSNFDGEWQCSVYLVADQAELDRLANIKPSSKEMYQAIFHLRWEQFRRVWGR
jgi:hypothetical protein